MNEGGSLITGNITCTTVYLLDIIQLHGATSKACFVDTEDLQPIVTSCVAGWFSKGQSFKTKIHNTSMVHRSGFN